MVAMVKWYHLIVECKVLTVTQKRGSIFRHDIFPPAVVFLKNTTALKMAGKKYHGEGKIGENHKLRQVGKYDV
jgi:hypothetical protein